MGASYMGLAKGGQGGQEDSVSANPLLKDTPGPPLSAPWPSPFVGPHVLPLSMLQDEKSLMDCQAAQEEPEGRPGAPGKVKELRGNPGSFL